MDKQSQNHLNLSIRESVPLALDLIGMHETAEEFRGLRELANPYQIEQALDMLNAALPKFREAGKGLSNIIRAGSPEVAEQAQCYREGLATAQAAIEAACAVAQLASQGRPVLN